MRPHPLRHPVLVLVILAVTGCAATATPPASSPPTSTASGPSASSRATPDATPPSSVASSDSAARRWAQDLDFLDRNVRAIHPDPFINNPETAWVARIAGLKRTLPTMSEEDAKVAVVELVALLDDHSGVVPDEIGFHYYGLLPYEFPDGEYVVAALDKSLVGSQVLRIGNTPIDQVRTLLSPLVNHDNESSMRHLRAIYTTVPEFLRSKGIITDVAHPGFVLERPDGTTVTVDPEYGTPDQLGARMPVIGGLAGDAPEFVRRGLTDEIWWRIDKPTRAFLIGYNQAGTDATAMIAAMRTALNAGRVDRVVLDMRLAGGGDFGATQPLRDALRGDPRINRAGGLTVLISRENASASNALAAELRQTTAATFIGEPTPARPETPGDETTFTLPDSGIVVHVPTDLILPPNREDPRDAAVSPDIPVDLTAADFFAGRDRVLEMALKKR